MAEPESVPVRDLEVADRIARAVRGGKPADRTPTSSSSSPPSARPSPRLDARRRAARALALAGVAAVPDLLEARRASGSRSRSPRAQAPAHSSRRPALVAALRRRWRRLATQLDFSDDNTASEPAGRLHATAPTTATNTVTQETTSTRHDADGAARPPSADRGQARRDGPARPRAAAPAAARAKAQARQGQGPRRAPGAASPCASTPPGDLPVRRGRRQAALQRHPHRRAHLPRRASCASTSASAPARALTANGKVVPLTASPTGLELTPKTPHVPAARRAALRVASPAGVYRSASSVVSRCTAGPLPPPPASRSIRPPKGDAGHAWSTRRRRDNVSPPSTSWWRSRGAPAFYRAIDPWLRRRVGTLLGVTIVWRRGWTPDPDGARRGHVWSTSSGASGVLANVPRRHVAGDTPGGGDAGPLALGTARPSRWSSRSTRDLGCIFSGRRARGSRSWR